MTPREQQQIWVGIKTYVVDSDQPITIDGGAAEVGAALDSYGKLYRKVGQVRARITLVSTQVKTILANRALETINRAEVGDYIVTAPAGEKYVVKPSTFLARYSLKPKTKTVYFAKGLVIAVPNPYSSPIAIISAWGELQYGARDCMIADIFDPDAGRREGQPYIIAYTEFRQSYVEVSAQP